MENKVKDQLVTEDYAIYNSDCMLVLPTLDNESIEKLYLIREKLYLRRIKTN